MKKLTAFIIVLMLAAALAAGCGEKKTSVQDISSAGTLGELKDLADNGYAYDESTFIIIVSSDGKYYRVEADIPEDVSAALDALSWDDDDHDKKVWELIAPLKIKTLTDLNEQRLSQEELDSYIGKTGADLIKEGWTTTSYFPDPQSDCLVYGPFQYTVTFDSEIPENENIDTDELIGPLTVKSMEYFGLSSSAMDP